MNKYLPLILAVGMATAISYFLFVKKRLGATFTPPVDPTDPANWDQYPEPIGPDPLPDDWMENLQPKPATGTGYVSLF